MARMMIVDCLLNFLKWSGVIISVVIGFLTGVNVAVVSILGLDIMFGIIVSIPLMIGTAFVYGIIFAAAIAAFSHSKFFPKKE